MDDKKTLKELHTDPQKREITKLLAEKMGDNKEVELEKGAIWLSSLKDDITYANALTNMKAYCKELAELGYGEYKVGRWGNKTRFIFNKGAKWVLDVATGKTMEPTHEVKEFKVEGEVVTPKFVTRKEQLQTMGFMERPPRQESFRLRKGREVKIEIPEDLSSADAERLVLWIKALPDRD